MRRTFRIAADLKLATSVRKVPPSDDGGFPPELVPAGTRSVSVFLVNDRAHLILSTPFVPRPNLRGLVVSIADTEQIADLQYRDCFEYGRPRCRHVCRSSPLNVSRPLITLLVLKRLITS